MSTRGSLFYHQDKSGVSIHIYEEALDRTIHIEIEHQFGTTNVVWPHEEFMLQLDSPESLIRRFWPVSR